jgi:gas vesicle protein
MSETPRTDAAYSIYDLRKVAQDIERELNEANKTNRLQYELITTAEKRGVDKSKEELSVANDRIKRLEDRVKQLEEENDAMRADLMLWWDTTDAMCSKAGIGFTTEDKP